MNLKKKAKDRECMIRIPGCCNRNPYTTVLAHLNGAGMGMKHHDLHGAWACSNCHDAVDGRRKVNFSPDELKLMHLEGVIRTQQVLINEECI